MTAEMRGKLTGRRPGPLVSVVVPFFNEETFLGAAIESVLTQSYGRWELVLVDDGSTDGSTSLAREAARRDSRVTYTAHADGRNHGLGAARNRGLEVSTGSYIAPLDADDVWSDTKLEEQVALLEERQEAAAVYGRSEYWRSWSGETDYIPELGIEPGSLVEPPRLLTLALRSAARTPPPSNVLLRRSALTSAGGFVESVPSLFEDQAFLARIYLRYPVLVDGRCWIRYRLREDSIVGTARASGGKQRAGLEYFAWLEDHLRASAVADRELWRALRQKQRRYRHSAFNRLFLTMRRAG